MSPRLILITSLYYWPEAFANAPYVTGVAEHLANRGDDVVIVTGFPHYPQWTPTRSRRLFASESNCGVRIRRRWHYVPRRQGAIRRAFYEASFLLSGLTALPLTRRPDAIIGVSPTLSGAALAATASATYRRPYGVVFQDLVGRAAEQSNLPGARRHAGTVRRIELRLACRAKAVAVISPGFTSYLEEGGVYREHIHHVQNWTHTIAAPISKREMRTRLGWDENEFICLHSGNMGYKQDLDNLLDAARELAGSGVRVVFAGDGSERRRLESRAERLGLQNVAFLPIQPPGDYESMLEAADVLLVNQRAAVTDMSLPSRLTSYFAAGRAVVAAVADNSETRHEVAAADAGVVVRPNDPGALAATILALRAKPARCRAFGKAARRYAGDMLSREAALSRYDAFLEDLLRKPQRKTGQP